MSMNYIQCVISNIVKTSGKSMAVKLYKWLSAYYLILGTTKLHKRLRIS